MDELKTSEFYKEIVENITTLDEITNGDYDLPLISWLTAQSALKYITGKNYAFTRTDEYYGIVNDDNDKDFFVKIERMII